MSDFNYWFAFALVFLALCVREGGRTKSDKPFSRWLRRLYLLCVSRMGDKEDKP